MVEIILLRISVSMTIYDLVIFFYQDNSARDFIAVNLALKNAVNFRFQLYPVIFEHCPLAIRKQSKKRKDNYGKISPVEHDNVFYRDLYPTLAPTVLRSSNSVKPSFTKLSSSPTSLNPNS
jgi:hypothetical protein